jgi:uncharacterized protein YsxB (DUF464 family)
VRWRIIKAAEVDLSGHDDYQETLAQVVCAGGGLIGQSFVLGDNWAKPQLSFFVTEFTRLSLFFHS